MATVMKDPTAAEGQRDSQAEASMQQVEFHRCGGSGKRLSSSGHLCGIGCSSANRDTASQIAQVRMLHIPLHM